MTNTQLISVQLLPTGSFETYLQKIHAIPLLSAEEESSLAERYRNQADLQAAQALVLSHLRYVARIARHYAGYGLAVADLMQEGTIGLMKAVKRFDPSMGVRLASFAVHWIKAEMHEFIIRNWRIVRVATTKAQRKLFFNLRSAKKRLGWLGREEIQAVAQDLGVRPEDVVEMEARLNAYDDLSFDLPGDEPDDALKAVPSGYLSADGADPAGILEAMGQEQSTQAMAQAIKHLDERSQVILQERWLAEDSKTTFKDLAERFSISIERVRQLEQAAFKKLRAVLE